MHVRPQRRVDDLVLTESVKDLLVYDTATHGLHTLNAEAAAVFRLCDGLSTPDDLVSDSGLGQEHVHLALDQLREAGLLEGVGSSDVPATSSRRRFLRKAGIAAGVPAILSVTMPMASAAASGCLPAGTPCTINDTWRCCSSACGRTPAPDGPFLCL